MKESEAKHRGYLILHTKLRQGTTVEEKFGYWLGALKVKISNEIQKTRKQYK